MYLGKYWQDSDTNGDEKVDTLDEKSAIKWCVLSTENDSNGDTNGDSLLLMLDRVLDRVLFSEDGETSWEGSNIRKWLNSEAYEQNAGYTYTPGGFLNTAFSPTEQAAIKSTTKPEGSSLDYSEEDMFINFLSPALIGDKIFLSSAEELDTAAYGFYHYGCWSQAGTMSPAIVYTSYAKTLGVAGNRDGLANYWIRSNCVISDTTDNTQTNLVYYDYEYHIFMCRIQI